MTKEGTPSFRANFRVFFITKPEPIHTPMMDNTKVSIEAVKENSANGQTITVYSVYLI